jgi:hypothetical protein
MRIATGLKRQASVPSARRRFPAKMGLMSGGTAKPLCGALRHSQPFVRDDAVTGLDAGIMSPLRQPRAGFSFASKIRFPRHGEITLKLTFWFMTSSRDVPSASQSIYDLGRRWSPRSPSPFLTTIFAFDRRSAESERPTLTCLSVKRPFGPRRT